MRIGINGRFFAAPLTGVQRFARELTAELVTRCDAVILAPANAVIPEYINAEVVRGQLSSHAWEQMELPNQGRAACDVLLHLANAAPLTGGPHVMVVHDVLPMTHPEWFTLAYAWWQKHVIARAVRRAAHVLVPSQWSAAEVERVCGVPKDRLSLITQGLTPFTRPATREAVDHMRHRLGLDAPFVLGLGQGDRRKNLDFLIPVVETLRATVAPRLQLVLVSGGSPRVHGMPTQSATPWVKLLPAQTDAELHALYTAARALCFPSLAEGFGRPPLEAAACGTRAVSANYAGASGLFEGIATVLPLHADQWVRALLPMVESEAKQSGALPGVAARLARFNWATAADQAIAACAAAVPRPAEAYA